MQLQETIFRVSQIKEHLLLLCKLAYIKRELFVTRNECRDFNHLTQFPVRRYDTSRNNLVQT